MLKSYCQKCGALNAYISERPNFCQRCGQGFNNANLSTDGSIEGAALDQPLTKDEEPTKYNLNALEVEIDIGNRAGETLSSLMETGKKEKLSETRSPAPDQPYSAEDFRKEAGNARGGNGPEET